MAEPVKQSNVVQLAQRMRGEGSGPGNGQDGNLIEIQKEQLGVLKSIDAKLNNIKIVGAKNEKNTSSLEGKTQKTATSELARDSSLFKLLGAAAKNKLVSPVTKKISAAGSAIGSAATKYSGIDFAQEKIKGLKDSLFNMTGVSEEDNTVDASATGSGDNVVDALDNQTVILTDIRDAIFDQFGYEKQKDLLSADASLVSGRDKNEPANDNKKGEEKKEGKGLLGSLVGLGAMLFGAKSMFGKTIGKLLLPIGKLTGVLGSLGIAALSAGIAGLKGVMSKIPGLGFLKPTPKPLKPGAINKKTGKVVGVDGKDTVVDKKDKDVKKAQNDIKAKAKAQTPTKAPATAAPASSAPSEPAKSSSKPSKPNTSKLKSVGKGLAKIGGGALRVAGKAFLPLTAVLGVIDGVQGAMNADVLLGKEGEEVTGGERAAAGVAGVLSGLTFGLLDSSKTAKGLSSFFGLGKDKSVPTGPTGGVDDFGSMPPPPSPVAGSTPVGGSIPAASKQVDTAKELAASTPAVVSAPTNNNQQTTNNNVVNNTQNAPKVSARPSQMGTYGSAYNFPQLNGN